MFIHKRALLTAAMLAGSQIAIANNLNLNGFMSVGAGVLSNSDVSVAGYDDDASFNPDTIAGLQASSQVNDSTSATIQLVARGADDYEVESSWAYVTYSANENTDVRIGRLRTPFYYYSDFLEVGYAYNWVRPPSDVYSLLEVFSSVNGVDVTHNFSSGDLDGSIQVYYGRFNGDFKPVDKEFQLELKHLTGAVFNLNKGNLGARLSYHQADLYFPDLAVPTNLPAPGTANFMAALGQLDPVEQLLVAANLQGFSDQFIPNGDATKFYEAAITYDNGSTSFIAEWTSLDHDTKLFTDSTSYLVSAAQRFDETTVHLTYSSMKDKKGSGAVGALQEALRQKEDSIILGARFDYDAGTAFKIEAQYIDEKIRRGTEGESAMLYTVAVDLIF